MSDKSTVLKSYSNIKKIKNKIYRFGNIKLLVPVETDALAIFGVSLIIMLFINGIIEIPINAIYKFVAIPIGITMIIKTTKIEGKAPHIYLWRLIQYQGLRKKTIENFEVKEDIKEIVFK